MSSQDFTRFSSFQTKPNNQQPATMQLATVLGHATSTIKHASMHGLRLVVVQPLNVNRQPEADPMLVVDKLSSSPGDTVILAEPATN